jgi:hypothetical protein
VRKYVDIEKLSWVIGVGFVEQINQMEGSPVKDTKTIYASNVCKSQKMKLMKSIRKKKSLAT